MYHSVMNLEISNNLLKNSTKRKIMPSLRVFLISYLQTLLKTLIRDKGLAGVEIIKRKLTLAQM